MTARADVIRLLLERWQDLLEPRQEGRGGTPGLTLMPHDRGCSVFVSLPPRCDCYRASVRQLEQLLAELRELRQFRDLRWQLLERYLHAQTVIREQSVRSLDKHGKVRRNKSGIVYEKRRAPVLVFDSRVDATEDGVPTPGGLLDAGLEWLASRWQGAEPRLPVDWQRLQH